MKVGQRLASWILLTPRSLFEIPDHGKGLFNIINKQQTESQRQGEAKEDEN